MNKEGAKQLFKYKDDLRDGVMKKPKSRTKRRHYDKKNDKKFKKNRVSRTKRH